MNRDAIIAYAHRIAREAPRPTPEQAARIGAQLARQKAAAEPEAPREAA